jgi:hypothetical protein
MSLVPDSSAVWWVSGCNLSQRSRPAHVHVIGSECEAVFHLNCPYGPVELREDYGSCATTDQELRVRIDEKPKSVM